MPEGVEHVRTRTRALHEEDTWLIITDFSCALNTANNMAALAEVVTCVPVLTRLMAKCCADMPAGMFFWMDSEEHRTIDCSRRAYQRDLWGCQYVSLSLRPGLKRCRLESEGQGVKSFACMGDVPFRVKTNTV